jgi:hypothetical protein
LLWLYVPNIPITEGSCRVQEWKHIMTQTQLRVAELPKNRPVAFSLRPDAVENSAIATQLGLLGLRKLSFKGTLHPAGKAIGA